MKRNFKYYGMAWAVLTVLFHVFAFVLPHAYTASFWIGYGTILIALIGQLICAYVVFKKENPQARFYHIPLITISFGGLIASFAIGSLCMLISVLPYWIGTILCALVLAFTAISVIKAQAAAEMVSAMDQKIKEQTFLMRALTMEAEGLMAAAASEAGRKACQKVYEAFRYADPKSCEELAPLEDEIKQRFAEFKLAAGTSEEKTEEAAAVLLGAVALRNEKCKLYK